MIQLTTPDGSAISDFCFGTMQWGGKSDVANSHAMYDACRAGGINFFDTAHGYTEGASEQLLGQFVAAERDEVFVATKVASTGDCRVEAITADFEECRKRLNMDQVDLLYMHRWNGDVPLEPTYEFLARQVQAGRVRHIGVSNYSAWQVMKAQSVAEKLGLRIDVIQPMYSLVKRQVEVEILPMALSEDIGIVPYSPLGGGLLTGKYASGSEGRLTHDAMYTKRYSEAWMHEAAVALNEIAAEFGTSPITLAVAWVAKNAAVSAPIISASSATQLRPSLDAMGFNMDESLYQRLTELTPTPAPATDRLEEHVG